MTLGSSLGSAIASLLRPTAEPSRDAQALQLAQGGGSDFARDRIVRNDSRARALAVTGVRVGTRRMLDRAGVTKPAAAKRA